MKQEVPIGEAARILALSIDKVRELADSGELECQRTPGGHRRFSPGALEAFRASRRRERARPPRSGQASPSARRPRPPAQPRGLSAEEWPEDNGWGDRPRPSAVRREAHESSVLSTLSESLRPESPRPEQPQPAPEPDPVQEENRLALLRQYGLNLVPPGVPRSYESEIRDGLDDYVTSRRFPAARPLYEAYDAIRAKVEAILERHNDELAAERRVEELIEYGRSRASYATSAWDFRDGEEAREEILDELERQVEDDWSEGDIMDLVDETLSEWVTDDDDDEESGW